MWYCVLALEYPGVCVSALELVYSCWSSVGGNLGAVCHEVHCHLYFDCLAAISMQAKFLSFFFL